MNIFTNKKHIIMFILSSIIMQKNVICSSYQQQSPYSNQSETKQSQAAYHNNQQNNNNNNNNNPLLSYGIRQIPKFFSPTTGINSLYAFFCFQQLLKKFHDKIKGINTKNITNCLTTKIDAEKIKKLQPRFLQYAPLLAMSSLPATFLCFFYAANSFFSLPFIGKLTKIAVQYGITLGIFYAFYLIGKRQLPKDIADQFVAVLEAEKKNIEQINKQNIEKNKINIKINAEKEVDYKVYSANTNHSVTIPVAEQIVAAFVDDSAQQISIIINDLQYTNTASAHNAITTAANDLKEKDLTHKYNAWIAQYIEHMLDLLIVKKNVEEINQQTYFQTTSNQNNNIYFSQLSQQQPLYNINNDVQSQNAQYDFNDSQPPLYNQIGQNNNEQY